VSNAPPPLSDVALRAAEQPMLRTFGAPSPELIFRSLPETPSLVALHLAAAFHRMSVVLDVLNFYARRTQLPTADFPTLTLLIDVLKGEDANRTAVKLYREAADLAPDLAEAHYGLARLAQGKLDIELALAEFETVLRLPPHPQAPPHAFLHANAEWERATILESQGRNEEALRAYRAALAALDSFGVHHIRVARFLRRLGRLEEAAFHFRRCMTYTHRYFPEFNLPPLASAASVSSPPMDVVYETQRGEMVIFWQGEYVAVPPEHWPITQEGISELASRSTNPIRRATSIAALEMQ
jgi:tetratricopeptide (TPR) repeat protein